MIRDLALGIRLAVGGGRISGAQLLRLGMTALGIGMAVAVLLSAASIGNAVNERAKRSAENSAVYTSESGNDPLYEIFSSFDVRGEQISVKYVAAGGPTAPVPPGLSRLPEPGELVVSPEVARMLDGPHAESVRARLPGAIIDHIDKPGLTDTDDRVAYLGAPLESLRAEAQSPHDTIYGFGGSRDLHIAQIDVRVILVVLPVALALLLPLLIFITNAARMGATQRERRLAALRLLGLDAHRVRRVAAAESLLGAAAGLGIGTGMFFALRPLLIRLQLSRMRFFASDILPPWPVVLLIVALVFALSVGASIVGLRKTIIEPLGVVRHGRPPRRRLEWRWLVIAIGVILVLTAWSQDQNVETTIVLSFGIAFLLIGISVLLPWLVEQLTARLRGGSPSWQLAIRRLQLDSGTPSRVVSGLLVVLAGAILTQSMMLSQSSISAQSSTEHSLSGPAPSVQVFTNAEHIEQASELVNSASQVEQHRVIQHAWLTFGEGDFRAAAIGSCSALSTISDLPSCSDGDTFIVGHSQTEDELPSFPDSLRFSETGHAERAHTGPEWTVPDTVTELPSDAVGPGLRSPQVLITEQALDGVEPPTTEFPDTDYSVSVEGTAPTQELLDNVATALQPLTWHTTVEPGDPGEQSTNTDQNNTDSENTILLAGVTFVLVAAVLNLAMLSIEQIVERRRQLAALSVTGVPISVLLRSSLWQVSIPVLVGVFLAVTTGIGCSVLVLHFANNPVTIDTGAVLVLVGIAVLTVLVCTALTWPLLRQVTKLDSLRTE